MVLGCPSTKDDGLRLSTNRRHAHGHPCLWLHLWIWNDELWFKLSWIVVSLATTLNMEWEIVAQARLIYRRSLYMTTIFPNVRDKVRWWRKFNCKFAQYLRTSSNMCLKHLLGCWCPFPRSDPSKMNLFSCRRLVFEASVWRMGVPTTVLAWMKIKTMIFHMANSITVLHFIVCCGSGAGSGTAAGELSYNNPTL